MKVVGLFEAKTKFSAICQTVLASGEPVLVTRRGEPLVRIEPVVGVGQTIRERRAVYMAADGAGDVEDAEDFEPPTRSREISGFGLVE